MKINRFLGLVVFLMSMNFLAGQNVQISANSDRLTTDEVLTITVEISDFRGRVNQPMFPNVPGFSRLGPSTSQRYVNGRRSVGFSFNYRPNEVGSFTIPKLTYELNNKRFAFGPKKVEVTKGSGKPRQRQNDPFADMFRDPFEDMFRDPFGGGNEEDLKFQETNADYFMSFDLNRQKVYVGQAVTGEVSLFINERDARKVAVDALAILEMQQRIKNSGFWQEVYDFKTIPMKRATVNGKSYFVYTLYRTFLYPLKTGTIEFKDLYLEAKKLYVASNASIRQRFLGRSEKFEPITIRAPKRSLEVVPLPPTQLPNASSVGEYRIDFDVNAQQLNTGEVLEFELQIDGTGNMAMAPDPILEVPKSFNADLPSSRLRTNTTESGTSGRKNFTYTFIPTRSGRFDLGPAKFYYFDPKKEAYDSLVVDAIPIVVTGEDLENIKLKQSAQDEFYETALSAASTSLDRDQNPSWWMVLAPLLLLLGAAVFAIVRNGRAKAEAQNPAPPTSHNPLDD